MNRSMAAMRPAPRRHVLIEKGQTPLVNRAIEARLEALGIEVDAATGVVFESGLSGSKVKGGLARLEGVAPDGVINLEALDMIAAEVASGSFAGRILGPQNRGAILHSQQAIQAANLALEGAESTLASFVAKPTVGLGDALSVFRRLEALGTQLGLATSKEVLRQASREQLDGLRTHYASFLEQYSKHSERLAELFEGKILPMLSERFEQHNELIDRAGGSQLRYEALVQAHEQKFGSNRELKALVDHLSHYSHTLEAIFAFHGVFR